MVSRSCPCFQYTALLIWIGGSSVDPGRDLDWGHAALGAMGLLWVLAGVRHLPAWSYRRCEMPSAYSTAAKALKPCLTRASWVLLLGAARRCTASAPIVTGLEHALLLDVPYDGCSKHARTIPAAAFAMFQMLFAAITPLLMTGILQPLAAIHYRQHVAVCRT